ncbi:MAG TPA: GspH/FimT family pseudopilin [Dongiaceae bacterium]|nr:GspH/FimT family pseudopilin [Dongiaceae bacterium]
MRAGQTLPELLTVLTIIGVLSGIALPNVKAARDQAVVRDGITELAAALNSARAAALRRDARAVAAFDTARGEARVIVERDTLLVRQVGAELGVTLSASRDSVVYGPSGRGYGAANTTLIVRRGAVEDTITVSRLGRVRRAR